MTKNLRYGANRVTQVIDLGNPAQGSDFFPIEVTNVKPRDSEGQWTGQAMLPRKQAPINVMIFAKDQQYFLLSALCPHQGYDLSNEPLNDKEQLICPLHNLAVEAFAKCTIRRRNSFHVSRQGEQFLITGFNE